MTAQEKIGIKHGSIAVALAAAQTQMGKALKSVSNTHFKNKYADLSSVMDACLPALNAHGIAVIQPTTDDETGRYVETVLIHGESGQELRCRVPLIVQKNDMQGYGSAVTYARRYGLMSMAGIAPEDDDGNAAARAAPKPEDRRQEAPLANRDPKPDQAAQDAAKAKRLADDMLNGVTKVGAEKVKAHQNFARDIAWLERASPADHARVMAALAPQNGGQLIDDEIPY